MRLVNALSNATQERTPCKIILNVPKMGHLNPSVSEKDLLPGTFQELPLWLVDEISLSRQPIVAPDLPKIYRESYREILKADATAVDLHKFSLYFYEVGAYIKHFDRKNEVHDTLIHTFRTRFRQLMDLADNTISDPSVQQKLDMLERKIFNEAYKARVKMNNWLVDSSAALEAANMVVNHKKRKRINVEDLL
ncbi:DNA replication complex GINS protein PSF3 isoform X2 [Diorhabda sublineata]|uniref:DNA replication complex GINS protein PSF3 isoform X2 n=1 Tax=Diorhabda sublineata TaxID=1163346 RepID=UPI0024E0D21A|nr:DNA replication complex GINS protein PSF3 isoform X2 [Diorhabda sublineata]